MFWTLGCIYGATSVAFGAFGAHGLKKRIADPTKLNNWATAAHYQVPPQKPWLDTLADQRVTARPLRRPPPYSLHRAEEQACRVFVHHWDDYVQWKHILAGSRSTAVQVSRTCYTVGRIVPHRWLGCTGVRNAVANTVILRWVIVVHLLGRCTHRIPG